MKPKNESRVHVHPENAGERVHGGILLTREAMQSLRGGGGTMGGGGGPIDPDTPPPQY
jgi:hypothetical protein